MHPSKSWEIQFPYWYLDLNMYSRVDTLVGVVKLSVHTHPSGRGGRSRLRRCSSAMYADMRSLLVSRLFAASRVCVWCLQAANSFVVPSRILISRSIFCSRSNSCTYRDTGLHSAWQSTLIEQCSTPLDQYLGRTSSKMNLDRKKLNKSTSWWRNSRNVKSRPRNVKQVKNWFL